GFSVLFAANRWVENKEGNEQLKHGARQSLGARFDQLNQHMTGKNFVMGERFSAPDCYLYTCLRWSKGMEIDLGKWPSIAAFMARMGERPKVKEALAVEGLKP